MSLRAAVLGSVFMLVGVQPYCHAQSSSDVTANPPIDEVLVTGERPGPGMWRISKDGHDLWILATLRPLPKNMTWRSVLVEQRIAGSQAVLSPPDVDVDVGFFRGITLIPALLRARKSPDGRTLEEILPHDLYIRWLALRVKYLGSYDEHRRPILAAIDLYEGALNQAGLTDNGMVWSAVEKAAKGNHVPVQPVQLKIKLPDAKGAVRDLGNIPQAAEIDCFAKTVERLEVDLQPMRQRANFWALGDIQGLRSLPYPDGEGACLNAFLAVPQFKDQYESARSRLEDLWISAAKSALDINASSFAVLPITALLKEEGAIDRLKKQGYEVLEPQ
ncbi:MAG TPA: TraB/GumN family protein [Acidobacteriaceae bacterium]|nr:TraB/GumN family protein [Acidobacteriaceae bacterium]